MLKNICLVALVAHAAEESFQSGLLGDLPWRWLALVPFIVGGLVAVDSLMQSRAKIRRALADIRMGVR